MPVACSTACRALRAACQFYCLRAQSLAPGRDRAAPRATVAQLLPPSSEDRWRGLQATAEVSLLALLDGVALVPSQPEDWLLV